VTECREDLVDTEYVAPEGELDQLVADISAEVLGLDRIGRTDSYYDFGMTSLQAVRICARIHRLTTIRALPVWLFTHDVLADFVARLREPGADDQTEAAAAGDADVRTETGSTTGFEGAAERGRPSA
jgi:Phosphopantetheine attachment site